ncbi:type II CAAX prenyl endopeptidase Rce1 family protein [Anoxybacter fermentans]|nr:CPBP family glutamic-type intramembrane protease [Anoxybacter fermentans]
MNRAWTWTEYYISCFALIVIYKKFKDLSLRYIVLGILLSGISYLSFIQRTDICTAIIGTIVTFITFLGGSLLSGESNRIKSLLILQNYKSLFKSFLIGVIVAIPFALINYIYFRLTLGKAECMNIFSAGFLALEPAISEEIVFRFFTMNSLFYLLNGKVEKKYSIIISFFFGIIPHSLIHFPELWIYNIPGALFMLISTSLLFGLPMAFLQYKRNLETAITFHWFIDFIRFFGGY